MKKRILCGMMAAMTAFTFVSCGQNGGKDTESVSENAASTVSSGNSEEASDPAENSSEGYTPDFSEDPYTVHFQYCVAAEGSGLDGVREAVDALAMSEMNMHVDLIPMTIGTWSTTMSMMLAANEALDLFANGSGNFSTYIDAGYLRNWADYLDYVPDVVETMGDDVKAGYVGDFLVGFSQMKERGYKSGLVARADIMDALGIDPESFSITTQDYDSYSQITELFAKVKEAYPEMTVNGGTQALPSQFSFFNDGLGDNFGLLPDFGQSTEIKNWFESDQCKFFCDLSREWFTAGYYSADAATNQDSGETLMRAGNLFSYFTAIKPNTNIEKKAQTGYDVYVIPTAETTFTSSGSVNGFVYSLANASEDPVKAAAFYNWAFKSGEFEDLINWGVKDVDWVETDDGLAAYPDGISASNAGYHQDYGWIYPNQFAGHPWDGNDPDIWQQYDVYNASLPRSAAFGFTFNSTVVSDQIATCTSVYDQYDNDLFWGAIEPEQGLADLNSALYAAGLQDIIDAKQSQLDEWLASSAK